MISIKQRRAYTEVLAVLEELKLIDKIPSKLLDNMKNEQDKTWNFTFNKDIPIEKQILTKSGAELLTIIYLVYICNNLEEKKKLKKIYEDNEKRAVLKKDFFEILNNEKKTVEIKREESLLPIKKETLIEKIKKYILNIFRK